MNLIEMEAQNNKKSENNKLDEKKGEINSEK